MDTDVLLCHDILKDLHAQKIKTFFIRCELMEFLDCQIFICNRIIHFMG
jgi:hypothetical protein